MTDYKDSIINQIRSIEESSAEYIVMKNLLKDITITDLLSQMMDSTCTYYWCGILPAEKMEEIQEMITSKVPTFLKSMLSFTEPQ